MSSEGIRQDLARKHMEDTAHRMGRMLDMYSTVTGETPAGLALDFLLVHASIIGGLVRMIVACRKEEVDEADFRAQVSARVLEAVKEGIGDKEAHPEDLKRIVV